MTLLSKTWFEVLSELFVNLSAGWFMLVLVELHIGSMENIWLLIYRFFLGMLTLTIAKLFREESKKIW